MDQIKERLGIVQRVGNQDFFFVEDLETGEAFFAHLSCVAGDVVPREGDKVSFDHLSKRVGGKNRPVSRLEIL